MAFTNGNFKEAGGPGNEVTGGQVYSYHSTTDALATIMASGYFDTIEGVLNDLDIMIISGSDATKLVRLANTAGVITVSEIPTSGPAQSLSGPGAADIVSQVTEVTTTGADAVTLADGAIGQQKTIVLIVDGGTMTLTPANALGYTSIAFADAGDSVQLEFRTGGWALIGQGGLGTGPLSS